MSSQQQATGAEERRPEGFQRGDLVCPDGGLHPFTVLSDENEKNNILSECQLYKNLNKNACDLLFLKNI